MRALWTKLPKFILCNLSNMKPSVKKNKTPKDGCGKCVCVCLLGNLDQARDYKEQKKGKRDHYQKEQGKKKTDMCMHLSICPGVCRFECLSESNEGQSGQKGY